MAILDTLNEFADNVSVAAAASTAVVGNVIDLGAGVKDYAAGADLYVVIKTGLTEIITGGSAGTIQFHVVSDSLATLGAGVLADCTTHASSAILITDDAAANSAALNAGQNIFVVELPHGTYERYLGVLCTIGTTTVTAGTVDAYLTTQEPRVESNQYAQGTTH
jgi:hypothetical protein